MRHLPIFLDVTGRDVLVVGGGDAAFAKMRLALRAGARVRVVAPNAIDDIAVADRSGTAHWQVKEFQDGDLAGAAVVYSATGKDSVDGAVSRAARAAGLPVNVVDRPHLCTFITPSIIDRSPIQVAVSSGGAAPVLARSLRAKLERLLPDRLGALALFAERFRDAVKAVVPAGRERRRFWDDFFSSPVAECVLKGDEDRARRDMLPLLNGHRVQTAGEIYLIDAGSGDPELMTLRDHRLLQTADLVVHDRAVPGSIIDLARRDAEFVAVDAPGETAEPLVAAGTKSGLRVVRLTADQLIPELKEALS